MMGGSYPERQIEPPERVRCPDCGHMRWIDIEECPYCEEWADDREEAL